jgi:hypothetical protein
MTFTSQTWIRRPAKAIFTNESRNRRLSKTTFISQTWIRRPAKAIFTDGQKIFDCGKGTGDFAGFAGGDRITEACVPDISACRHKSITSLSAGCRCRVRRAGNRQGFSPPRERGNNQIMA